MAERTKSNYFSSQLIERVAHRSSGEAMTHSRTSERVTRQVLSKVDLSPEALIKGFNRSAGRLDKAS